MSVIAGVAGASRNAAVALCDDGRIQAVCEQERVTRTRRAGLRSGRLPNEALDAVLRAAGRGLADITSYAVAEPKIELPLDVPVAHVPHHAAHAATAFDTSGFQDAVVLVCDRHALPEVSVWEADARGVRPTTFRWTGPGFATVYSRAAHAFGFAPGAEEHRLESLARVADRASDGTSSLLEFRGESLAIASDFEAALDRLLRPGGASAPVELAARVASDVQRTIGEALLRLVQHLKTMFGGRHLCLGGGLFFNSYFNSLLAQSGVYERTFVPVNPGNAGIAVGAALSVAARERAVCRGTPLSPFLGPGYEANDIKATIENCKLSYDYVSEHHVIERTVDALAKGKLVGWFQGRMEWGPRALGNRSILANPLAPFVLENLNAFLKHRASHRSYSVSTTVDALPRFFQGPPESSYMEFDYEVIQPDVVRSLLPLNGRRLRVQTVRESTPAFHQLLESFGQLTGVPMLVNTSFNGFNEPIVCTPRDAIRVFYGTGLDMVVVGRFILTK
jgi:carbamoyltransferase